MTDIQEVGQAWGAYLRTVEDWHNLVPDGAEAKVGGCGLVFDAPNPIDRPGESFAIADMTTLPLSEPHSHTNGETEIYIVLQGVGKIAVGSEISSLAVGDVVVTPPDVVHIVLPVKDLILAVINVPPFNPDNVVPRGEGEPEIAQIIAELRAA